MDAGSVRTRKLTIVAQDPGVMSAGRILKAAVDVPAEELAPGPRGYRVHVIDYDASTRSLYRPFRYPRSTDATYRDPYGRASDDVVVGDPGFHAQNVYAIVMRTLSRFEFALGRRVSWAFGGHQVQVAPHAFAEANAFYSERDQALLFGYFPGRKGTVFSCLSHDVVAHETTHALVDGLRTRYTDPSSPDQAAFHEGFSDIAALLSVFSLRDIVQLVLTSSLRAGKAKRGGRDLLHEAAASAEALKQSALLGLAEQMGEEMSMMRGQPLRRSVKLEPAKVDLESEEFKEPHRRGEVLVAAVMNAFVNVWVERLEGLGRVRGKFLDLERVAEEGAAAADYLLTMCIRSLDYCPPVHLEFGDFLSALVTADFEIRPDDSRYRFREHLVRCFGEFGILPASHTKAKDGRWMSPKGRLATDRAGPPRTGRSAPPSGPCGPGNGRPGRAPLFSASRAGGSGTIPLEQASLRPSSLRRP